MNFLRLSTLSLITMIVIPIGAYAHCPGHAHCDNPTGGDGPMYSVTITQDVMAQSVDPWSQGGKRNSIGAGVPSDDDFFTNLGVIVNGGPDSFTQAQGAVCFAAGSFPLFGGTINQGKQGRAEASFWFEANTFDGLQTLFYQLHFIGVFEGEWLPVSGVPTDLTMNDWELTATNEGKEIKDISCIGEGTAFVIITVTEL